MRMKVRDFLSSTIPKEDYHRGSACNVLVQSQSRVPPVRHRYCHFQCVHRSLSPSVLWLQLNVSPCKDSCNSLEQRRFGTLWDEKRRCRTSHLLESTGFRSINRVLLEIRLMVHNRAVNLCTDRSEGSWEVAPNWGFDCLLGVLNSRVSGSPESDCNLVVEADFLVLEWCLGLEFDIKVGEEWYPIDSLSGNHPLPFGSGVLRLAYSRWS